MRSVVDRRFVGIFRSLKPVHVTTVCQKMFGICLFIWIFMGRGLNPSRTMMIYCLRLQTQASSKGLDLL